VELGKRAVNPAFRCEFDFVGDLAMMARMSKDFIFAPQTRDGHRPAL
jgi:hypothetical protein